MKEIDRVLTVTEAKNRLLDIVRSLRDRDEIIAITRGGDVAAVVLSPDRYEGLLETIEILSDRRAMESLRRSVSQAKRGRWVSDEKVFGKNRR